MRFLSRGKYSACYARSPLLRLLICEVWFRIAVAGFILLALIVALLPAKIWRGSPAGFQPVLRVSALDLAQAWSLQRSALAALAGGKFVEANYAWQAALANNRGDAELVRGVLRTLIQANRPDDGLAGHYASWLLKLTATNRVDLELVANVLEKYDEPDLLVRLLAPRKNKLTPSLEATYLKALFNAGSFKEFRVCWQKSQMAPSQDAELPLYHAAYLAGWGVAGESGRALRELEEALDDPRRRVLAGRLLLAVSARQLDGYRYEAVLRRLDEWQGASFQQRIGYWRTLARSGRQRDAIQSIEESPSEPGTATEVVKLAELWVELGLRDRALQLFRRYSTAFRDAPILWIAYARALLEGGHWEELRSAALQMRGPSRARDYLAALSFYFEGKAELGQQRLFSAAAAFQKMSGWDFHPAQLGLTVSADLFQSGFPEAARNVLLHSREELAADAKYWALLFRVAAALKDEALMLSSASQAHQLRPADPILANDYAAALLIQRRQPSDAIKLTFSLFSQNPRSLVTAMNHAGALLLNQRPAEAEALLRSIPTHRLSRTQAAIYDFNSFEAYFSLGELDRAALILGRIDLPSLYPTQRRWLEQARERMPARPEAARLLLGQSEATGEPARRMEH